MASKTIVSVKELKYLLLLLLSTLSKALKKYQFLLNKKDVMNKSINFFRKTKVLRLLLNFNKCVECLNN